MLMHLCSMVLSLSSITAPSTTKYQLFVSMRLLLPYYIYSMSGVNIFDHGKQPTFVVLSFTVEELVSPMPLNRSKTDQIFTLVDLDQSSHCQRMVWGLDLIRTTSLLSVRKVIQCDGLYSDRYTYIYNYVCFVYYWLFIMLRLLLEYWVHSSPC